MNTPRSNLLAYGGTNDGTVLSDAAVMPELDDHFGQRDFPAWRCK